MYKKKIDIGGMVAILIKCTENKIRDKIIRPSKKREKEKESGIKS